MNDQTGTLTSLFNQSYTFQSVSGKNTSFTQSVSGTPFFFRSGQPDCSALSVPAGGQIYYSVPVHLRQAPLPYACLFFILEGRGSLLVGEESVTLAKHDALLLSPGTDCGFSTTHTPFSYYAFYLQGSVICDYLSLLCPKMPYFKKSCNGVCHPIHRLFLHIVEQLSCHGKESSLYLSTLFHMVLSILLDASLDTQKAALLPPHVIRMKEIYDFDYAASHSLASLEAELGISKYRLCRDFSQLIGMSPVQYLNQVRLSHARHLLCTTDLTIREVGISVGIENTTHFINLFKKSAGITPLQFRQTYKL